MVQLPGLACWAGLKMAERVETLAAKALLTVVLQTESLLACWHSFVCLPDSRLKQERTTTATRHICESWSQAAAPGLVQGRV